MLPRKRTALVSNGSSYHFITLVAEETELIGLYYGGQMFYALDIENLTATVDDVASGEKFIGKNGTVETGRAGEVS